jgi:hypothetical protein
MTLVGTAAQVYQLRNGVLIGSGGRVLYPSGYVTPSVPPTSFVLGITKPDATNTGVPAGWNPVTTITGDTSVTRAGTTFTDVLFNGNVKVQAPGVTFTRCWFAGNAAAPTGQIGLLHCQTGSSGTLIDRCTVRPQTYSYYTNGVLGHDFTLNRCNISGTVDGCDPFQSDNRALAVNVTISGTWIHDLAYFSPSPTNSDNRTHSDGVQYQGGSNMHIIGSRLDGLLDPTIGQALSPTWNSAYPGDWTTGSAFIPKPDVAAFTTGGTGGVDWSITDSWLNGGNACINCAVGSGGQSVGNGQILRNRFGRDIGLNNGGDVYTILIQSALTSVVTGDGTADQNVYEDNGLPVHVRRQG